MFRTAKKKNLQINLSFNFLIQKYFFHENPTWSRYSEYLLMVKSIRQKDSEKNGIGIECFLIGIELRWN